MLDDHNHRETDLSTIDVCALTPAEWEALKREVVRRAHAERGRAMRAFAKWLFRWIRMRLGAHSAERSYIHTSSSEQSGGIAASGVTDVAMSAYPAGDIMGKKGCDPCR